MFRLQLSDDVKHFCVTDTVHLFSVTEHFLFTPDFTLKNSPAFWARALMMSSNTENQRREDTKYIITFIIIIIIIILKTTPE